MQSLHTRGVRAQFRLHEAPPLITSDGGRLWVNGDLAAGLPQVSDGDDGGQSRGQPSWWECYVIYVPGRAGLAYHILVLYCYAMVADIET